MKLESEPFPKRRIDAMTGVLMLLTLAALAGTAWLRLGRPSAGTSGATVGANAPPLQLIDPETSQPIVLAGLKDKVAWVVFWSAGSESGRTCLAELETATRRLRMHRRFALVAAAAEGDDAAKIRSAARAAGFQQPVYLAAEETRRRFHAEACDPPLHVLIDAGGGILAMARGDGRPTIDRIAQLARDRLDEIDPDGQTRFASAMAGFPRHVCPFDPLGTGHAMHPCGARGNLID